MGWGNRRFFFRLYFCQHTFNSFIIPKWMWPVLDTSFLRRKDFVFRHLSPWKIYSLTTIDHRIYLWIKKRKNFISLSRSVFFLSIWLVHCCCACVCSYQSRISRITIVDTHTKQSRSLLRSCARCSVRLILNLNYVYIRFRQSYDLVTIYLQLSVLNAHKIRLR